MSDAGDPRHDEETDAAAYNQDLPVNLEGLSDVATERQQDVIPPEPHDAICENGSPGQVPQEEATETKISYLGNEKTESIKESCSREAEEDAFETSLLNDTESLKPDVVEEDTQDLKTSRELTPPPLPPRPSNLPIMTLRSTSPPNSSKIPNTSARPQLQSKATTALSLADVATPMRSEQKNFSTPRGSRAASRVRGIAHYTRRASRSGSDTEDGASIRSNSHAVGAGGDMESLLGAFRSGSVHAVSGVKNSEGFPQESEMFDTMTMDESEIDHYFKHEFDDLESLASDYSNEESLMIRWRLKLKHFMILSSAGKPIYSRHGDDQLISNTIGVIQTILSIFIASNDSLKSFTTGNTRFVIVSKGHLHLLAISRLGENDTQLRIQLESLYTQILSTLTLPTMERMFLNRPSTDLRRPLEGTETLLSSLADGFTRGSPSTLLSALECLRIRKTQRDVINRTLTKCKNSNLLYGLVVAGGRLVSVIRPRKHSLHPGDLHLIFNMLFEADGIRAGGGENWIPLCLPGFNNTGYLYMYVSFLRSDVTNKQSSEEPTSPIDKEDEIAIILISTNKESFYDLRKMRDNLVAELEKNGSMAAIRSSVAKGRRACTDIAPGTVVRHFLYKSRANVQFTMPALEPQFNSGVAWRKLMSLYVSLHSAVHGNNAHLKVYTAMNKSHISLAWVTPLFEMYCVAAASASRTALAQGANKIVQWAQSEEQRLFVIGGAVF